MTDTDDVRHDRPRRAAILAVLTPWRAGRLAARPPLRVRYFVMIGLLWYPAILAGSSAGSALHDRLVRIAPQAALMGAVATVSTAPSLVVAWRVIVFAAAWLVGGVACGAVLVGLGSAILGALLRDRPVGSSFAAVASLFSPIAAFATGMALAADVWVIHRRDWLATALVGALALWSVVGWTVLAATAARRVDRPRLRPAWCAASFALASIVVLRIASEAAFLPLVFARWLLR